MAKKKISLEEAVKDFAQAINDATKILLEDVKNLTGKSSDDEDDAEEEDEEEEVAPKKAAKGKGKKAPVDEDDEEEEEADEDEPAPKKKAAKGKKAKDEDDEEDDAPEYSDVQAAVAKAAKANGRDFVAERLKRIGGKKCDHASKLKAEQYADFIESLSEEADED